MAKFGYQNRRQMEPRPGVKYSTEYYQQTPQEFQRTLEHVQRTAARVAELCDSDPEYAAAAAEPQRAFRRSERGRYYSMLDIVGDMLEQMIAGRDIPSGMLGRWNRLFDGTGAELDMVPASELPPPNTYWELFK